MSPEVIALLKDVALPLVIDVGKAVLSALTDGNHEAALAGMKQALATAREKIDGLAARLAANDAAVDAEVTKPGG